ncbi:hypothetical protein VTK26DRAFT_8174 [Humicola hyalothermophila]
MKLEVPALRSDHIIDFHRLVRRVKEFFMGPLANHRLPLHPADIENGEGLEFPQRGVRMDREQISLIENERLEVNKEALAYFVQSLKSGWTAKDQRDSIEGMFSCEKIGATEHLPLPLSPLKQPLPEYFVPDEEVCELPDPSNPSSSLDAEIENVENRIFRSDTEFWAEILETDVSPDRFDDVDVSEMIRKGGFRSSTLHSFPQPVPRGLELDVPMLPCSENDEHSRDTAPFLGSSDFSEARALVLSSDTLSGSDGPTGQLVSFFQQRANAVVRSAEQEKLQPLDAVARVLVPIMDFSVAVPEWEERLWEPKQMFQWIREMAQVHWQGPKWPSNKVAEQRMVWSPLAHMGERNLTMEHLEINCERLDYFLERARDDGVPTSADYVYKRPGLAILCAEDDDGDENDYIASLEPPSETTLNLRDFEGRAETSHLALQRSSQSLSATTKSSLPDLNTLLNGRKRLIDETITGEQPDRLDLPSTSSEVDIIDRAQVNSTNVLRGFMSEYTDFAPLVDNFVDMNFRKKPKLTRSAFFDVPVPVASTTESKTSEAARLMPPPPKPIPAIGPNVTAPTVPPRIVISSTLSKSLISHLETLIPGIEPIHRNYGRHEDHGADLVISPATGILLTTMVKLRQKPMPPSDNPPHSGNITTPFCNTAAAVAARHERLIVLVSEGNKHSETTSPLSQSDARALAEFQGFAAGLQLRQQTEIRVVYVGGGIETLARWVAASVCDEWNAGREEAAGVKVRDLLLPVETYWEVFLRRAGMNAFAAQVVLGRLKVPDGQPAIGGTGGELCGLPLFVTMSRERRIESFQELLGGRRVLDRVSEAIDEPWGQRALGESGFDRDMGMGGWAL